MSKNVFWVVARISQRLKSTFFEVLTYRRVTRRTYGFGRSRIHLGIHFHRSERPITCWTPRTHQIRRTSGRTHWTGATFGSPGCCPTSNGSDRPAGRSYRSGTRTRLSFAAYTWYRLFIIQVISSIMPTNGIGAHSMTSLMPMLMLAWNVKKKFNFSQKIWGVFFQSKNCIFQFLNIFLVQKWLFSHFWKSKKCFCAFHYRWAVE